MNKLFVVMLFLFVLSGCASSQTAPLEKLSKLPVVPIGDSPPADSEYIVFYPAGYEIPLKIKAKGSFFAENKEIESVVALTKNLYLYKYWASHDKNTWASSHELLGVKFAGGFDISGIHVIVALDAK